MPDTNRGSRRNAVRLSSELCPSWPGLCNLHIGGRSQLLLLGFHSLGDDGHAHHLAQPLPLLRNRLASSSPQSLPTSQAERPDDQRIATNSRQNRSAVELGGIGATRHNSIPTGFLRG